MADPQLKVLGVSGSLCKKSFDMAGLCAAGELLPAGMALTIAHIDDLPMFNQEVLDAGGRSRSGACVGSSRWPTGC